MQWKTKMKRTATTTSAIILALTLAACSNTNNNPITPTPSPSVEQTEDTTIPTDSLPEETGTLEPGVLQPGEQDSNDGEGAAAEPTASPEQPVSDIIKAEGIYVGAADSHSIEIKVGNDYLPLQVDDSLSHIIHEYQGKEEVDFEYIEKEIDNSGTKQLWLVSISVK